MQAKFDIESGRLIFDFEPTEIRQLYQLHGKRSRGQPRKLSAQQELEIVSLLESGWKIIDIAKKFDVAIGTIYNVRYRARHNNSGASWKAELQATQ